MKRSHKGCIKKSGCRQKALYEHVYDNNVQNWVRIGWFTDCGQMWRDSKKQSIKSIFERLLQI